LNEVEEVDYIAEWCEGSEVGPDLEKVTECVFTNGDVK